MKRCAEDGKCQKYLFSHNFACLVTNAALGAHWSCMKRCAEDGKCQKYLFSQIFACLVTNAVLVGQRSCVKRCAEDGKYVQNGGVHVNKVGTSIYNVDVDSQIIATHMLI